MRTQKLPTNNLEVQLQAERAQWVTMQQELQRIKQELESVQSSQAVLQGHQELLQMALEANGLGLWDWHIGTNKIYYDAQCQRLFGYEVEDIEHSYEAFERLVHPEDLPHLQTVLPEILQGRTQLYTAQMRVRCKAGEWKWLLIHGKICEWDAAGVPVRMTGTYKEISDRKHAELALLLFRQTMEHSSEAVVITNLHGHHFYHNRAFSQLFEYPSGKELITAGGLKALFANPKVGKQVWKTTSAGQPWEGEVEQISRSGKQMHIWLRAYPLRDAQGQLVGTVAIHTDVTAVRAAATALDYKQQQLQAVHELAHIGSWELDLPSGKITCNQELCHILGVERNKEPTLQELVQKIHPEDKASWLQVLKRAITQGTSEEYNFRIVRSNGEIRYLNGKKQPLKTESGQVKKLCGIVIDITDRQRTEQALQEQSTLLEQAQTEIREHQLTQASEREKTQQLESTLRELHSSQAQLVQNEKMASLGQLVAGVAHEINNPVNFIYANINPASEYAQQLIRLIELYQQHYPTPPAAIAIEEETLDLDFLKTDFLKLLWSMRAGADRIKEIVMALGHFSRTDQTRMKKADLHQGLDSTLMVLQHRLKEQPDRAPIHVMKEYGELPLVECYGSELNQVFLNILTNAIDALEDRMKDDYSFMPQIRVRTEVVTSHLSLVTNSKPISPDKIQPLKSKVIIRISDNGKGILPHIQRQIFDRFFTTKIVGKGAGLGLSISHQIVVEKHQGKLKCHSQYGKGSEFVIEINTKTRGSTNSKIRSSASRG